MADGKKKRQMSVYLEPDIMAMLADYAARRDLPQSLVAEAAIASFRSSASGDRKEAMAASATSDCGRSRRAA